MKADQYIFVCTHHKNKGKKSCSETHGWELINRFKSELKKKGLHKTVRTQHTGCLHQCSKGPALCIFPEGVFYGNVQPKDVKKIVKKQIIKGKKVKKLVI